MTENEYYMIQGYIAMLEAATPNGRYVHDVKNKLCGLRLCLRLNVFLAPSSELDLRKLIHKLYDIDNKFLVD